MDQPPKKTGLLKQSLLLLREYLDQMRDALTKPVMRSCVQHIQEGDAIDRVVRSQPKLPPLTFQSIETEGWLDRIILVMAQNGIHQAKLEMIPFQDINAWAEVDKGRRVMALAKALPAKHLYDLKEIFERRGIGEASLELRDGKEWMMQRLHTTENIIGVYKGMSVNIHELMVFVQTKGFGWKALLIVIPKRFPEIRGGQHPSIPPSSGFH